MEINLPMGLREINLDASGPSASQEIERRNTSSFARGIRSADTGSEVNSLLAEAAAEYERGNNNTGALLEKRARELAKRAQIESPEVSQFTDIEGPVDALKWGAGSIGSGLRSTLPAIAGGIAGGAAGTLVAGPVGGIVGGYTGATAAAFNPQRNENLANMMQDEEVRAKGDYADMGVKAGLAAGVQAALESLVPAGAGKLSSSIIKRLAKEGTKDVGRIVSQETAKEIAKKGPARYVAETAVKATGLEGFTEGSQNVVGQIAVDKAADRDTSIDWNNALNDAAAGAVFGGVYGGGHGAKQLIVPVKDKVEDFTTRFNGGVDSFFKDRRMPKNLSSKDAEQWLLDKDKSDVDHASAFAADVLNNSQSQRQREAAQEFLGGGKSPQEAELYMRSVRDYRAADTQYDNFKKFGRAVRSGMGKLYDKMFGDNDRLGMAMGQEDSSAESDVTYNLFLKAHRTKDAMERTRLRAAAVSNAILNNERWSSYDSATGKSDNTPQIFQRWIESGFGAEFNDGEALVPDALLEVDENPEILVTQIYDSMKQAGMKVPSDRMLTEVVEELKVRKELAKQKGVNEGRKVEGRGDEDSLDDEAGWQLADDIGTDGFQPNEIGTRIAYFGKSDKADVPFSMKSSDPEVEIGKLDEIRRKIESTGISTQVVGAVQRVREEYANATEQELRDAEDAVIERHDSATMKLLKQYEQEAEAVKQQGKLDRYESLKRSINDTRERVLEAIDKTYKYLRHETEQSAEMSEVRGEDFNNVTPGKRGNKWAVQTKGKDSQDWSGPEHGRVWFERADGTKFATSAYRLISLGRKAGYDNDLQGVAKQAAALETGITSFLNAKVQGLDGSERNALSGRFGVMRDGEMMWGELPNDLLLIPKAKTKLGDVQKASKLSSSQVVRERRQDQEFQHAETEGAIDVQEMGSKGISRSLSEDLVDPNKPLAERNERGEIASSSPSGKLTTATVTQRTERDQKQVDRVMWVIDHLAKGVPAFNAAMQKAKNPQSVYDALASVAGMEMDSMDWGKVPEKDRQSIKKRATELLNKIEKSQVKKEESQGKKLPPYSGKDEGVSVAEKKKDRSEPARLVVEEGVDLNDVPKDKPIWVVSRPVNETEGGQIIAAFNDYGVAQKVAEHFKATLENTTTGILEKEGRFANAQEPDGTEVLSDGEKAKVIKEITKRLGKKVEVSFVDNLMGKLNGDKVKFSGDWAEGVIRILGKLTFNSAMTTAYHESMHEFFNRVRNEPAAAKVAELMARVARTAPIYKQLERLLSDHPNALKQISTDYAHHIDERLAYAYQFWKAGKLSLGPETKTLFQKIEKFLREVTGLLTDEQKLDRLFQAFDEGKTKKASAAAEVLAKLESTETMLQRGWQMTEGVRDGLVKVGYHVTAQIDRMDNETLSKMVRMFNVPEGERGKQGLFEARAQMSGKFLNRLDSILLDADKADVELAHEALKREDGKAPSAPGAKEVYQEIRQLLDDMHDYITEAKVMNRVGKSWKPVAKRDNYFPTVYDSEKVSKNAQALADAIFERHKNHIKDRLKELKFDRWQDEERQREYALAVVKRMARDGSVELSESAYSLGFSPFMRAANERSLDWIDNDILAEYKSDDVVEVMSKYVMQAVKRAEYVRRFDNEGGVIQHMMGKAVGEEAEKIAKKRGFGEDVAAEVGKQVSSLYDSNYKDGSKKSLSDFYGEVFLGKYADKLLRNEVKVDEKLLDEINMEALKVITKAQNLVVALEGTLGHDMNEAWKNASGVMMTYQNWRILIAGIFSVFIDPLGLVVRGATVNEAYDAFLRGVKEVVLRWKNDRSKDELTKLAESIGTVDAGTFLEALGQTYSSLYMNGKMKRLNDTLFKINGMEAWNRAMRVSATGAAINFIQRHAAGESNNSQRWIDELYFDSKPVFNSEGELDMANKANQEAVMRWVDGAILRPNAAQRPAWASDPHWALIFHFKQFAYSFHLVILKRAYGEMKNGNLNPVVTLMAGYIPVMVAADTMKSLLLSGDEPPWMKQGVDGMISHGAMRANLLGIPQLGLEAYNKDLFGLAGPSVEWAKDWVTEPIGDQAVKSLPGGSVISQIGGR